MSNASVIDSDTLCQWAVVTTIPGEETRVEAIDTFVRDGMICMLGEGGRIALYAPIDRVAYVKNLGPVPKTVTVGADKIDAAVAARIVRAGKDLNKRTGRR